MRLKAGVDWVIISFNMPYRIPRLDDLALMQIGLTNFGKAEIRATIE